MPTPTRSDARALALYRCLLRCYPAEFRQEYGREMRAHFRRSHRDASRRGIGAVLMIWATVLVDTTRTAAREHLDILGRDLRHAWRALRRDSVFLMSAGGVLALGVAAVTTAFCIVDAVLLRPLPYPDPSRLVVLSQVDPHKGRWGFAEPTFLEVRDQAHALLQLSAFRMTRGALQLSGGAETADMAVVSPAMFSLLGMHPIRGRAFGADADRAGSGVEEVVITQRLWQRQLQSRPDILSTSLVVDGVAHLVVGVVLPPAGLFDRVDLFLPLAADPLGSRSAREIDLIGRLAPGSSAGQAQAELSALASRVGRDHAATDGGWDIQIGSLRSWLLGPDVTRVVWTLFGAVGLLWMLACTNVASLVSARATVMRHELGVRSALGASQARLAREIFTAAGLLSAMGGVAGLLGTFALTTVVSQEGAALLVQLAGVHLNMRALGVAAILIVLAGAWCGLLPILTLARINTREAMAGGGRTGSARRGSRALLVGTQVAIAVVLVAGASLLLRSLSNLDRVDPGYNPESVLTVQISMDAPRYDSARRVQLVDSLPEQLRHIPGIVSVGATNVTPFGPMSTANRFRLEGQSRQDEYLSAAWRSVTPGFFAVLNLRPIRGRLLDDRDRNGNEEVVVITESMARRFWPDSEAVGQRLLWGSSGNPKRVVGVVPDLRDLVLGADPSPTMFRPFDQLTPDAMTLLVRGTGSPDLLVADLRAELRRIAPDVPLRFERLTQAMAGSILRPRVSAWVFASFATMAILLASAGLYGLVTYDVTHRRRDTAIRLALGASRSSVVWGLQRDALLTAGAGAIVGLLVALALAKVIQAMLFATDPRDPAILAGVALLLITIAFVASRLSARGALRVNPIDVLRSE